MEITLLFIILCLNCFMVYDTLANRREELNLDNMVQSVVKHNITGDAYVDIAINVHSKEAGDVNA